ncbi:MAG: aminopeptidase P family protein, partial [Calditrichales bacterium]
SQLVQKIDKGIILIPGNEEVPMNYLVNTFHFRQDSTFLYYFGLDLPGLTGVIDAETGKATLFGDDLTLEDIIWMGQQPSIGELAGSAGISATAPVSKLTAYLSNAQKSGQPIHFLPPYRESQISKLSAIASMSRTDIPGAVSKDLIEHVIRQRSVKSAEEIVEIEKAHAITYDMHTTAMRMARPGMMEQEIAGIIEGIALSAGGQAAFPVIVSVRGEILHNHFHGNRMKDGDLLINDSGAENALHYAADITRTFPVNGRFSDRQKDIYEIVLNAVLTASAAIKPGIKYRDIHLEAAGIVVDGLKSLGLMKGNTADAVAQGAHALFFPHGLGHMLGLDVHDMENLGEDKVGYNEKVKRSDQFGLAYLRLGKELEPGYVITVEPGVYFIPELVRQWSGEKKLNDYIAYNRVQNYLGFGGIRIEDNVVVTTEGGRVLGKPIPKTIAEVEATCQSD